MDRERERGKSHRRQTVGDRQLTSLRQTDRHSRRDGQTA